MVDKFKTTSFYSKEFVIWLLLYFVLSLSPVFASFLEGKPSSEIYTAALMTYFVLAMSNLFHLVNSDKKNSATLLTYAVTIVWIVLLIILATKHPYGHKFLGELFSGGTLWVATLIFGLITIVVSWRAYYPFNEKKRDQEKIEQKFNTAKHQSSHLAVAVVSKEEL